MPRFARYDTRRGRGSRGPRRRVCKARAMDIGILGGTGPAGKALAARLASVGMSVSIGSRSTERGEEIAAQLREKWAARDLDAARRLRTRSACEADLVVVATPWDGAASDRRRAGDHLEGKVVVSMANALVQGRRRHRGGRARPRLAVRRRAAGRPGRSRRRAPSTTCPPAASPTSSSRSTRTSSCARTTPRPRRRRSTLVGPDAGLPRRSTPAPCRRPRRSRRSRRCSSASTSATRSHASIRLTGLRTEEL